MLPQTLGAQGVTAAYPVEIYGHGRARPARTGTPLSLAFALALARQRLGLAMKQGLDLVIAAFLLLALAPILAAIALLIRADGGPALFRHKRLGANDRAFPCLKFRSMRVDADAALADILATDQQAAAEWEAVRKLRDDPRVTRIGRFLRKTSLDELPQLINVLRREMSLVGPRPIVEAEKAFYGSDFEYYTTGRMS